MEDKNPLRKESGPTPHRILFLMWLTYGSFYLCRLNLAPVVTLIMDDLHISHSTMGLIMALFFALYASTQFPAGYLSDRLGPKRVIVLGSFLSSLSNLLFGLSSRVHYLIAFQLFNGVGQGGGWGPSVKLICSWFPKSKWASALGIYGTCISVFTIFSYWMSSALGQKYGWRLAFLVPSSVLFCVGIIHWVFVQDSPRETHLMGATHHEGVSTIDASGRNAKIRAILIRRSAWLLAFSFACVMFLDYTYLMWTPTFLFEAFGLTVVKAGIFSSIYPLVGLVARPLGGYLSDFFFRRRETLMLIGLTSLTVLTFALSCALSSLTGTILVLGFIAFFSQLITMLFFVSMADLFTAEFAGSGAGFTDAIGHVGTISAMVIAGIVIDTFHSYRLLFMILSGVALLGTMCMVLKPER